MRKAIIVDLDGTLCNINHRRSLIECEKPDWKSFSHPWQIKRDGLNAWCSELIRAMCSRGHKIIFLTGREGTCDIINATNSWLQNSFCQNWLRINTVIYFRAAGDYRRDFIIKREIFDTHIKNSYEILFVVDDRKQVVDMWREMGLIVLHCAEGNF